MKLSATLALILLLSLLSCGSVHRTLPGSIQPRLHQGSLSLGQALAELDALPTPAGTDPAKFSGLKQALRAYLVDSGMTKFTTKVPTDQRNMVDDLTNAYTDDGQWGVQWNYKNVGDYNFDGEVNISDLTPLGADLGKTHNSPDWDSARFSDGDGNGEVNISDITPIGAHFLNQVIDWALEGADNAAGPFAPIQTEARLGDGSVRLATGMISYVLAPAVQKKYYRVAPLSSTSERGINSNVSVQFIISPETKVIGDPGMPTYASRNVNSITLNNPPGDFPIAIGDIIVGEEDAGYMLRVVNLTPQGNQTVVAGVPAPMKDVFVQGGVGAHFYTDGTVVTPFSVSKQSSATPIPDYDFDISNQVLHDDPNLRVEIESGLFNFLPNADVAINYNKYRGVTYMKALLDTDSLKLNMTAHAVATNFTGTFPATPDDALFYERFYTSLGFNLSTRQNGVPVVVAVEYDIYLGTTGTGTFNGETRASMNSVYTNLLLGGIYTPGVGVDNYNQSTPHFDNMGVPQLPRTGGDFDWRVFVRPEVHMKLYGNPVPGSSEDLDLRAIPYMEVQGSRTASPEDGYTFAQNGGLDSYYKMTLFHLGSADVQVGSTPGVPQLIRSGFEPDSTLIPRHSLSGEIDDTAINPVADVRVELLDSGTGDLLAVDYTDSEGQFWFDGLLEGTTVIVRPVMTGAAFTPPNYTQWMDSDKSVQFTLN